MGPFVYTKLILHINILYMKLISHMKISYVKLHNVKMISHVETIKFHYEILHTSRGSHMK